MGAAGVAAILGTGDCKRGDRRVGAGEGLRERLLRVALGCPLLPAGGASNEDDTAGEPLAATAVDCRQGGVGSILSHLGEDVDAAIATVGAVGGTNADIAGVVGCVVVAHGEGGATCKFSLCCDDCGVAGMTFMRGRDDVPSPNADVGLSTTAPTSGCPPAVGKCIHVGS